MCYEINTNVDHNNHCLQLTQKNFMVECFSMLGYRLFEQPSYVSGHDPPMFDCEVEFVYDKDSDSKEKQFPELEYIANYRSDAEEQNIRRLLEVIGEC